MSRAHRPFGVMRIAQSAQRLHFALRVAGALGEFERPLVLRAASGSIAQREIQIAALVVDTRQLAVESVARGQFLRMVERGERRLHRARHPVPGRDADPCGAPFLVVGRERQRTLNARMAPVASPVSWQSLPSRAASASGRNPAPPVRHHAATVALRIRCAARRLPPVPHEGTRPPRADRRRGPGARHRAPHRAPRTSRPHASATHAARCAAATHRRRRGSVRARTSSARTHPPLPDEIARLQRRAIVAWVLQQVPQHSSS